MMDEVSLDIERMKHRNYEQLDGMIKGSMKRSAAEVVRLGFLLRRMMDEGLYSVYYSCFDAYLEDELHMDYTAANRFIGINKKYSVGGKSDAIDERYAEYSQGLLIEMLSMPPELEKQITPDMTVRQAREIKRDAKQKDVKLKPDVYGLLDNPYCSACNTALDDTEQPARCPKCGQLQDWDWYNQTYWPQEQESPEESTVIEGEYREVNVSETEQKEEEQSTVPSAETQGDIATSQPHDARWFVQQYARIYPGEAAQMFEICRKEQSNSKRAKAIQEYIAPYGYHGHANSECEFSFQGFSKGMDFQIGDENMHLKYKDLVAELMKLLEEAETGAPVKEGQGKRLTEKDEQGNWAVRGLRWEELRAGKTITEEMHDKLYGCLWKLMEYEDTGLDPEQAGRIKDRLEAESKRFSMPEQEAMDVLNNHQIDCRRPGDFKMIAAIAVALSGLKSIQDLHEIIGLNPEKGSMIAGEQKNTGKDPRK